MKTKNSLHKAAFMAAFICFFFFASAQNLVQNGNLENGFTTCMKNGSWNNGPFYLGENLVTDWTGLNYGAGAANHPTNSGFIHDNTAGCTFGKFNGVSAYSGNRCAQVYMSYSSGVIWANWAKGNLTAPLAVGCYWVCIATNNNGTNTAPGIVEVVLESSVDGSQATVLRYIIPANSGWKKNKGYFKLIEGGKYDRILIRMDQNYLIAHSSAENHVNNLLFDDVSIAGCTYDPDLAVAVGNFDYNVNFEAVEGEEWPRPIIDVNAHEAEEMGIHRWDIYAADDQGAPASDWAHLTENSGTVLEDGHFNSGTLEQTTDAKVYNIVHIYVNPCYGWALEAKMVRIRLNGQVEPIGEGIIFNPIWSPEGNEFGEPGEVEEMQSNVPTGDGTAPMYNIFPNPPVNTITIVPIEEDNEQATGPVTCEVLDVRGAVVIKSTDITLNNTINISNLPTGIYFVKIATAGKVEVQKFYKK